MIKIGVGIFLIFLMTSCVSHTDLVYLQKTNSANSPALQEYVQQPYRVQINDILSINLKSFDEKLVELFRTGNGEATGRFLTGDQNLYFNGYSVSEHGSIRIPLLGEIEVIGKTTEDIRHIVEQRLLQEYFTKEAGIFVSVKLYGFRYVVNGEVNMPGSRILYQDKVTILEALANAGDITLTGNRREVMIVRQTPAGAETHYIDLTADTALKSPYYYLQPNDYVYVKPLKQKSWGTGRTGVESLTTILSLLTLVTTTLILLKK
ncbi:MAG: sugar transporter [Flavobacterium sp. BFFFF2]|nr:MAG: sugar transporter [Flavobacterium sp. BFFFF2]